MPLTDALNTPDLNALKPFAHCYPMNMELAAACVYKYVCVCVCDMERGGGGSVNPFSHQKNVLKDQRLQI